MSTYSQGQWEDDFEGQPVRVLITCKREGYDPWMLLKEIQPPRS